MSACGHGFGGQHARQHRVVAALDARHVHEAGIAADQRAAGECELRHRLVAAFGDRARAIGEALAAGEGVAHQRMRLEALEFLERRQIRIGVVEMHDEADRHQIVVEVIEERAAAGRVVERPAEGVLHQPLAVLVRRDLPKLLQAEAEFLRLASLAEFEPRDQLLAEIAARAFGEQRVFGAQLHAAREGVLRLAVLADAHVAGGDAGDRAVVVVENLGRGKARIDFDAERLRLCRQPAADVAERDDEVAVIAHQRRHHEIRQPQRAGAGELIEAVVADRGLDRRVFAAPIRQQPVEADRIDHRAGEDVGADLGALLHHHDGNIRVDLLEPDRGGEPGRTGADHHHVEFHRLAGGQFGHSHLPMRPSIIGAAMNRIAAFAAPILLAFAIAASAQQAPGQHPPLVAQRRYRCRHPQRPGRNAESCRKARRPSPP